MAALEVGLAVVALLVLLPLVALHARRRLLQRRGGTIELSMRLDPLPTGSGWVPGVARFEGDELRWYRVVSLAPFPRRVLSRRDLRVMRRRELADGEGLALHAGSVVVECRDARGPVELAMDRRAATGFLAWLESQPPGATLPV